MGKIEIDEEGNKFYYNDKDQFHRLDGPASEWASGSRFWCVNDEYHRLDGPAIEYTNGSKYWFVNSKYHRLDGPAIEFASGTKFWYVNGLRHRLDGPAIEEADGTKSWYVNHESLSEQDFNNHPLVKGNTMTNTTNTTTCYNNTPCNTCYINSLIAKAIEMEEEKDSLDPDLNPIALSLLKAELDKTYTILGTLLVEASSKGEKLGL